MEWCISWWMSYKYKRKADSGYTFSHWESNAITANNLENENLNNINLNSGYSFKAHFTTCDEALDVSIENYNDLLISNITGFTTDVIYKWYANGQPISNDSIIYNPSNGVYKLYVTSGNCQVLSDLFIYEENDYDLQLYPNPAQNEFELVFLLTSRQDIEISLKFFRTRNFQ